MTGFLAGVVTLAHFMAAAFFLRFYLKTRDRLFISFALAFLLFSANQGLANFFDVVNEPTSFVFALRLIGFGLIVWAILDKNVSTRRK